MCVTFSHSELKKVLAIISISRRKNEKAKFENLAVLTALNTFFKMI